METFGNSTIEEIDEKLEKDLKEYNKKIKIYTIIGILLFCFIFKDFVLFRLKFSVAVPYIYETSPIDTQNDPIQINYPKPVQESRKFVYTSLINNHKITIIPQAYYKLSGLVVGHNHMFFFKSDFFDSAALYDLGTTWGLMSDKKFYKKYFRCYSEKNEVTGARVLWTHWKTDLSKIPLPQNYNVMAHTSHSHLVPANKNIMSALLKIRVWDKVEIEGELVDMEYMDKYGHLQTYRTSTVRNDSAQGNRGNGSCETIYVTKVKIGRKVYK